MNTFTNHTPINIPLMLALDANARSFLLQHSIRFSRFQLNDGRTIHGLKINAYNLSYIKNFILNNHLLAAELQLHNFARQRADFIDLSKGFTYSALSWSFIRQTISIFQDSGAAALWNQTYPRLPVRWDGQNNAYFRTLEKKHQHTIRQRQLILLQKIKSIIESSPEFVNDPHHRLFTTAQQLLSACPPPVIILLFLFSEGNIREAQEKIMAQILHTLLQTRIADYLAMLLVEFAMQVSRKNPTEAVSLVSKDTSVTWEFLFPYQNDSKHLKMQILLSNASSTYHSFRSRLSRFSNNMTKHSTLQEYYFNSSDPEKENLLGLTYPELVAQECQKVGLHFETFVNTFTKSDQAIFNIVLRV